MDFSTLITTVGFPIAMCAWFIMRTEKVIDNNTKALNRFIDKEDLTRKR